MTTSFWGNIMRTLYIDASMGAAGDMITAALLELVPNEKSTLNRLNRIGVPNVEYRAGKVNKAGIMGTHVDVVINGVTENSETPGNHEAQGPTHHTLEDINKIIDTLNLPKKAKEDTKAIYGLIADAESKVHGMPVAEVHFHEVGEYDAIADIAAVCFLVNELKVKNIITSAVNIGGGTVRSAHGVMAVPAPATVELLSGVPIYSDGIDGELCTPTGAAILKYYANAYGNMPPMDVAKVGYGAGKKDLQRVNVIRIALGETIDISGLTDSDLDDIHKENIIADSRDVLGTILNKKKKLLNTKIHDIVKESEDSFFENGITDRVIELRCNIDDQSPEQISYASELLLVNGALDVYSTPVVMKKGRLGTLFTVVCKEENREKIVKLIFKHTTTIGIRETLCHRYILDRKEDIISTDNGNVRVKTSFGYGTVRHKYEYNDLKFIAKKTGLSIQELIEKLDS